jgi:hypothetical protein
MCGVKTLWLSVHTEPAVVRMGMVVRVLGVHVETVSTQIGCRTVGRRSSGRDGDKAIGLGRCWYDGENGWVGLVGGIRQVLSIELG